MIMQIEFKCGNIVSDSNKLNKGTTDGSYSLKKTSMNLLTALKLSATNIKTKKGRTFLTSFASSIGIIGIAVILSLLYSMTDLENIAKLNPIHAISLLVISVVLTMIGGWLPAKTAAKKYTVESLRS